MCVWSHGRLQAATETLQILWQHHVIHQKNDDKDALNSADGSQDESSHLAYNLQNELNLFVS